jgi:hypothetical protein
LLQEFHVLESTLSKKNRDRYNEILGEIELRDEIYNSAPKEKAKKAPKVSKRSKTSVWGRKAVET